MSNEVKAIGNRNGDGAKKWFEPTLTIGYVLQALMLVIVVAGAVFGLFMGLRTDLAQMSVRMEMSEKSLHDISTTLKSFQIILLSDAKQEEQIKDLDRRISRLEREPIIPLTPMIPDRRR